MHKVSNNVASLIFNDMFKKFSHKFRGSKLWNEFLNTNENQISSCNLLSREVKSKLLDTENEVRYF